jgi:hypothetical protein
MSTLKREACSNVTKVGHVPYYSKITQREEQLPYVIGLMMPPGMYHGLKYVHFNFQIGSDIQLLDIALACPKEAGRPTAVETGTTMFHTSRVKDSL